MKTKKKVFTRLTVLLLLFMAAAAMAPTASAAWDSYRVIVINHTEVNGTADLSSFPVLINYTADWLKNADSGDHVRRADGYDIVFTDADNTTLLDYEIEKYDGTAGTLVAWVRIPTLKHDVNTTIRLWYGNSGASDWSNPTGVWDDDYKGVWHLLGDGTTSLPDATSNSNTGTKQAAGPTNTASGQIDGAQDFDGSNDYVNITGLTTDLSDGGDFTIEAWVKADGETETYGITQAHDMGPTPAYASDFIFFYQHSGTSLFWMRSVTLAEPDGFAPTQWNHIAMVWDKSAATYEGFVNGESIGTSGTVTGYGGTGSVKIGTRGDATSSFFGGTMDEVRVSASARSAGWIKTGYNNQDSPSTFYSVAGTATGTEGSNPTPELPTVILFAVGLVVLTGYVWLRGKNN